MTAIPEISAQDNAKLIRIIGFVLFLFSKFLGLLQSVASLMLSIVVPAFFNNVVWFLQFAGLLIVAVGFFITFSKKQNDTLALFAGITLLLPVVLSALYKFTPITLPNILYHLLFNLFFIALAVRTMRYNKAIGILLILAFVYHLVVYVILYPVVIRAVFANASLFISSFELISAFTTLTTFGDIVCAVMALLSCVLEKDKSQTKLLPYSFG